MPMGDCERASFHHSFAVWPGVSDSVAGLLSKSDSNQACVLSSVVHTSRLGPAARYRGILAVSTVVRKRRVGVLRVGADAIFCVVRPTSVQS